MLIVMIATVNLPVSFLSYHFLNLRNILVGKTKQIRQLGYRAFSSKTDKFKSKSESSWKGVVGLEIHAQISSASKLFSGAATEFATPVNTNVAFFDAAIPGTLPVVNRKCIEAGVLTALALNCAINPVSLFDRKHYFYADLPAGYQITQQRLPLAHSGELEFLVSIPGVQRKPYVKKSRIKQLQLEQDSGKSLHDETACRSLVDLNRAGIPLMELVFEPDLESGEEAAALVKELILILQRLGTCSCKMEEGALRVDANISVHREYETLGVRTEVKNIGSVRGVAHAIDYEIERQSNVLQHGGVIVNETRSWDDYAGETVPMRDKEEKQDYRYMPEPNLPPLRLIVDPRDHNDNRNLINVEDIRRKLPELPAETREKLICKYGLSMERANLLVNENDLLEHFMNIINENKTRDPKLTSNILINEVLTICNKNKTPLDSGLLSSQMLGEIVDLLQSGEINLVSAKKILQEIVAGKPQSPSELVEIHGLRQITDPAAIDKLCVEVIEQNPKLVEQFCNGKTKVFNSLVGKIAKGTNNRANMAAVVDVLTNKLNDLKLQNKQLMQSK